MVSYALIQAPRTSTWRKPMYANIHAIIKLRIVSQRECCCKIQHIITMKESCYHVELFRQINNEIYGFATKHHLYLINMKSFQVMTIIDIYTSPSNECVAEIVTGNGCYDHMEIGEQWRWHYRISLTVV